MNIVLAHRVVFIGAALGIFVVVLLSNKDRLWPSHFSTPKNAGAFNQETAVLTREITDNNRYFDSAFHNDPSQIKAAYVEALRQGLNDAQAKLDIYFITRRYIDNGGDIYELYEYVNSQPDLAFFKEAEEIYPKAFQLIRERKLPFVFTDYGLYAYLAYVEVLEKHGYANFAMLGTAANQYVKMAYYKTDLVREQAAGNLLLDYPKYPQSEIENDTWKALVYAEKAEVELSGILRNVEGEERAQPIDVVYGAEQYASALRYLEALNVDVSAFTPSRDVSTLALRYSHGRVPELYLMASLSNAVTLLKSGIGNPNEMRNAIYPFLDIRDPLHKQSGITDKIIRARVEGMTTRWFSLLVPYSRENIVQISSRVPEFKTWLISNGWKEDDFVTEP